MNALNYARAATMAISEPDLAMAATALRDHWGIEGRVTALPGEYDLNFLVVAADGERFVFKAMRAGCDPAFVDMLTGAHEHARAHGAADVVPEIVPALNGAASVVIGGERIAWLLTYLPGVLMARLEPVTAADAESIGALVGKVNKALATFDHPLLDRELKWDLRRAAWIGERLGAIADSRRRARIEDIVRAFGAELKPRLDKLPRTPLHNDANDMNILFSDDNENKSGGRLASALFDFGDMIRGPRVCECAIAMAYAMMGPGDPLARAEALAAAFCKTAPLSPEEAALIGPLAELRLAVSVTNAAVEAAERPHIAYLQISAAPAWRLLDYLETLGRDHFADSVSRACSGARSGVSTRSLVARRSRVALANQKLFYDAPLRIVRGRRHFLYDADGAEYLDVYNNVPHVGHANPHVVDAVTRQLSRVNTNSRYLQDGLVDYAERMLARMPPSLTKIAFLNSASEANEIALRLARAATGARDMIVMEHCYHGVTTGAMDISPYKFAHPKSLSPKPGWVHVAPQPDLYRGSLGADPDAYVGAVDEILAQLDAEGKRVAGFISECVPSVGGQVVLPSGYLTSVYERVRRAGGVAIADDVQTGLGRLGDWFWGFEQQDAVPDIVVLGKPLGNGYPIAAVAMTENVAAAFEEGPEFFSTFGGSSGSCAAGAAVLDVLRDEGLPQRAAALGAVLRRELEALAERHELIGDIRGFGLFLGVELVTDRARRIPASAEALHVKNALRARRILLGTEGPADNVLKIRPPMTFDIAAASRLVEELDAALAETVAGEAERSTR